MSKEPHVLHPRTIQTVHIEFQQICQEIGFLTYQLERDIPAALEKLFNKSHDLTKEMTKLTDEAKKHQETVDKLKAQAPMKEVSLESPDQGMQ